MMQTASIPGNPSGIYITGGQNATYTNDWINNTGQLVYIYGLHIELMFGGMIPPAGSMRAANKGDDYTHYLQSVADLACQIYRKSDGMCLLSKASDHYDNDPELIGRPVFFPVPFEIPPGDGLHMHATGENGFQNQVGGTVVFNADCIIYFTK